MTFKKKMEIHDTMMVLHKRFMDDANSLKMGVGTENLGKEDIRKRIDALIGTMKSIAQLVDLALEVGEN